METPSFSTSIVSISLTSIFSNGFEKKPSWMDWISLRLFQITPSITNNGCAFAFREFSPLINREEPIPATPERLIARTSAPNFVWSNSSAVIAVEFLKSEDYTVYAIEQVEGSINLKDFKYDLNQKIALVFGNEVDGVAEEVMPRVDGSIEIPQFGTKHSLNIAVSAGIVIWEISKGNF